MPCAHPNNGNSLLTLTAYHTLIESKGLVAEVTVQKIIFYSVKFLLKEYVFYTHWLKITIFFQFFLIPILSPNFLMLSL
jgi:hypothetical protein